MTGSFGEFFCQVISCLKETYEWGAPAKFVSERPELVNEIYGQFTFAKTERISLADAVTRCAKALDEHN